MAGAKGFISKFGLVLAAIGLKCSFAFAGAGGEAPSGDSGSAATFVLPSKQEVSCSALTRSQNEEIQLTMARLERRAMDLREFFSMIGFPNAEIHVKSSVHEVEVRSFRKIEIFIDLPSLNMILNAAKARGYQNVPQLKASDLTALIDVTTAGCWLVKGNELALNFKEGMTI
jgi:hypothetical protein